MTNGFAPWLKRLTGLLLATLSFCAAAQTCATPGKDGAVSPLGGVINTYWPATASAGAGATSIRLGTSVGAPAVIAAGDLLLVMQMQDAAINNSNSASYGGGGGSGSTNLNSAGRVEFVRASSTGASGGTVSIVGGSGAGLLYNYYNADADTAQGQRRFQVVRVPQYTTATLGSLTATAWNGAAGGVLAFDVAGQLMLNGGTVNVDGFGFRGGGARKLAGGAGTSADYLTSSGIANNGSKGEGIAGTPRYVNQGGTDSFPGTLANTNNEGYPSGSHARGAPGNAGGGGTDGNPSANNQNTGGGGGANVGKGGNGGNGWSSQSPTGGLGGFGYSASLGLGGRFFMGGGGGAGTTNDGTGSPGEGFSSSGAAGGGLVMIRAGSITGSGTISAKGSNANNSVTNDGSGGGGAGGSVLVYANTNAGSVGSPLTVNANGGRGGTNTGGGSAHGPGGGGGGGFVVTSGTAAITVNGGTAGTTAVSGNFDAGAGDAGLSARVNSGQIPGVKSGSECPPSLAFKKTVLVTRDPVNGTQSATVFPKNIPGAEVLYVLRVTNTGAGTVDNSSIVITDPIPANTELFVGNLGSVVLGPIDFLQQGTLANPPSWTYSFPASTIDDVDFSNGDCVTFDYVPVPTLNYDSAIKCVRLKPKGTLAGASGGTAPYFELSFRVRIK